MRRGLIGVVTASILSVTPAHSVTEDGTVAAIFSQITCAEFIMAYNDEQAARARVDNPPPDVSFNVNYGKLKYFVAGMMSGINLNKQGKANFFPGDLNTTLLVSYQRCMARPALSLMQTLIYLAEEEVY